MIEEIKIELEESMSKAITSLKNQLTRIRTGRASASVLDNVMVDYYGSATPVAQVGQISTPEARLLQIQPFDKTIITAVEIIIDSNIQGFFFLFYSVKIEMINRVICLILIFIYDCKCWRINHIQYPYLLTQGFDECGLTTSHSSVKGKYFILWIFRQESFCHFGQMRQIFTNN